MRQGLLVVLRVSEVFFGVLDLLRELVGIEVLERNGGLGEQIRPALLASAKPPRTNTRRCLPCGVVDADHPRAHRGHDRRMVAEHLEVAFGAGTSTAWAAPLNSTLSGDTSSKWKVVGINPPGREALSLGRQFLGLLDRLLDGADHVEGGLGQIVVLAFDDAFEALDGVFDLHLHARGAGEHRRDVEGLRQESFDLRARATVCLSSSDNSSMPRIAMMSCSAL